MASQTASVVRFAALRRQCLSFAKNCSMGFRSGEYFGRKKSRAPAARVARRTALLLCEPKIVHDDDVAWPQRRDKNLFDIEQETLAVDRPVDEPWSCDASVAQWGQEGQGLPVAMTQLGFEPLAARRPAPQRLHVGLRPGLVDEHQAAGVDPVLIRRPLRAAAGDIGTVLLGGDQRLFL